MDTPTVLGPKDPREIKDIRFPFARELNGASIASATSLGVAVVAGRDPSPNSTMTDMLMVVGTDVYARFRAGISGVTYEVSVEVLDSVGDVHIMAARVAVLSISH